MPTPSSGSISFQNLIDEFGNPLGGTHNIGDFRLNGGQTVHGVTYPIDEGVPTSGSISFSQLRNRSLNVVVNVNGGQRIVAKDRYNNDNITVIGGGRAKKQSGSRIIIHVRNEVHSVRGTGTNSNGNRRQGALRTGGWGQARSVDIIVGPGGNAGSLRGGGGDGGRGGRPDGTKGEHDTPLGEEGRDGTSALELNHDVRNIKIGSNGLISAGGGGGAGGGGAAGELEESDERVGGGGGGGGQGYPVGLGGEAGSDESSGNYRVETQPQDGEDGSRTRAGEGGNGGTNNEGESEASAQSGGGGGGGGVNSAEEAPGGTSNVEKGGGDESRGDGKRGEELRDSEAGDPEGGGGAGGEGGEGDAEGSGQQRGDGGNGGAAGYAVVKNGYNITGTFSNKNRSFGRIVN